MKQILLVVGLTFFSGKVLGIGGIGDIVQDPFLTQTVLNLDSKNEAITTQNHSENIVKWIESIGKLQEQIQLTQQAVDFADKLVSYAGDPSVALSDFELLPGFAEAGSGQLLKTLASAADGGMSLKNSSMGLYEKIQETDPQGIEIKYDINAFKKYAAVEKTVENYQKVEEESIAKLSQMRQEAKKLSDQIKTAKDDATIQKLQGQLIALLIQMQGVQTEQQTAASTADIQKNANENNAEKQKEADAQASQQQWQNALQKFADGLERAKVR